MAVQPTPTPSSWSSWSLVSPVPEAAPPGDGGDDDEVAEDAEGAGCAVEEEGEAEREGRAEGGPQHRRAKVDGRRASPDATAP